MAVSKRIGVGIVGAGLIGAKRADAIARTKNSKLIAVADTNYERAHALASTHRAETAETWQKLVARLDIDVVIVAVPNAFAAKIVIAALQAKKHVLCEKPFGITPEESKKIIAAARAHKRLIKVGFNHRFHGAMQKAKALFDQGAIGNLIFIRGRYGHGGRLGMEKEWRFNKKISGGGELLDQGVHLIDLMRWFGGEYESAYGVTSMQVWKSNVEDNAFGILKNKKITASLHASVTNWGNIFSLEIFGDQGYLIIEGLGRWYGVETLKFGKRKPKFGDVTLRTWTFPGNDVSWEKEWKNFVDALRGEASLEGGGEDGLRANEIVAALYKSSKTRKEVRLR
jgi:predicted dehydrogenase